MTIPTCLVPGLDDRCERWEAIYGPDDYSGDGMFGSLDVAAAAVVAPDGKRTFVTGRSTNPSDGLRDATTIAYDSATGSELWVSRDGEDGTDGATAISIAPDGSRVFVTGIGWSYEAYDYLFLTIAYDAVTGERLWMSEYGEGRQVSQGLAIGASPDGRRVYVVGESYGGDLFDYATVAYDSSTGAELWSARYGLSGESDERPVAVAISPDGTSVFVTGFSAADYATVAYEAADPERLGERLWVARYTGRGGWDDAFSLGVDSEGSRVFVTGTSQQAPGSEDFAMATVAYEAATGAPAWEARHLGPLGGGNSGTSLAVNDVRGLVHVGGFVSNPEDGEDWDVAAATYDIVTGQEKWAVSDAVQAHDYELALSAGVDPAGDRLYLAGFSTGTFNYHPVQTLTFALDATTGMRAWSARYNSSPVGIDYNWTSGLAVSPAGDRVFTTGTQTAWVDVAGNQKLLDYDFLTLAYLA